MTTSEHLLRQYAVTTEISKLQHETMSAVMTDVLERQLRMETSAIGMTVHSVTHRAEPTLIFMEDGEPVEIVKLACIATGYMSDESAEQTLRKIDIANAQSDWTEDD
jgi:hypothetical protein